MHFFLVSIYSGFKSCPSLLETVGVSVPTRDFPLLAAGSSNKCGSTTRCVSSYYSLQRYRQACIYSFLYFIFRLFISNYTI
jgi:hypothetical protein